MYQTLPKLVLYVSNIISLYSTYKTSNYFYCMYDAFTELSILHIFTDILLRYYEMVRIVRFGLRKIMWSSHIKHAMPQVICVLIAEQVLWNICCTVHQERIVAQISVDRRWFNSCLLQLNCHRRCFTNREGPTTKTKARSTWQDLTWSTTSSLVSML